MIWVRISRIVLVLIVSLAAAIYLPAYYWLAFNVKIPTPRVFYSPIQKNFIFIRTTDKEPVYSDIKGNNYTREEFEQLDPLFNYRQLSLTGKLPDSLNDVKLDVLLLRKNDFMIRIRPFEFDKPQIPVYPLIESQSGRAALELNDNYFRFNSRMEILNSRQNEVDEILTKKFTPALLKQNFLFPAKAIYGNPTTRKPFDEGYFVIDAGNNVYHIKMVKGEPFCVNTNIPKSLDVAFIYVREMDLKEFYGLIFTRDNKVFLISYDNYKLIQLPIENYDNKSTTFYLRGDLFYRTITLNKNNSVEIFVIDRDYNLVDRYKETWKTKSEYTAGIVASTIFPFTILLNNNSSLYIDLYFSFSNSLAFIGIGAALLLTLIFLKLKKKSIKNNWFEIVIVLLTGFYGFIAITFIANIKSKNNKL